MRVGAFEIVEPVPELNEPHAFTMIRPWVDVGSVVSITLARLERHYGIEELGRLARPGTFFDFTRYRPTLKNVGGERQITLPNSVINCYRNPDGPDMMFLHLLEPHAYAEDYTDSVVELLKQFGVKRYGRLGAMYDFVPHTRPLIVTGDTGGVPTSGNAGGLRQSQSTYQGPTSIMNLVSDGMAELEPKVDTMNFMVHIPQYIQLEEDFTGAARLLEVLSSIYDLPADLPPTRRGLRQYTELDKAVASNSELKSLIERMENHYDSEEAETKEDEPDQPPTPLSPQIERFLQEMDGRFRDTDQPQ